MLRLHDAWEVQVPPEGQGVLLSDLGTGQLLRLNGDRARWLSVWRLLQAGVDEPVLERELRAWPDRGTSARRVLAHLRGQGVLVDRPRMPADDTRTAFDRQIRFFNLFETDQRTGLEANQALQRARVVLVGLGGYGVWIATILQRMGIREVVGIDHDRVELSNLHRQFVYDPADVGRHKAEVCAEQLNAFTDGGLFTPVVERVTSAGQFAGLASGATLVINTFGYGLPGEEHDHPRTFHAIAEGCERAAVPSLTFGGSWHGPVRVPGSGDACAGCLTRVEPFRSRLAHHPRPVLRSPAPSMPARLGLNACICLWEAVRFLSEMGSRLRSTALIVDTMDYREIQLIPIEPSPECVVCRDYRDAG